MANDKRNKIKLASELWKTMPESKGSEFRKEFKKKHGVSISAPASHYAKSLAGLVKKRKKIEAFTPTLAELKSAKDIAMKHGGVDKVLAQIEAVEAMCEPVGGIDQLKLYLEYLKELTA